MTDDDLEVTAPCCGCRRTRRLVVVALPWRGPKRVYGWGCVVCGLPPRGALALLCAECAAAEVAPVEALAGETIGQPERVPVARLTEPHRHDPARHRGEAGA
jgi:hypothetical protein